MRSTNVFISLIVGWWWLTMPSTSAQELPCFEKIGDATKYYNAGKVADAVALLNAVIRDISQVPNLNSPRTSAEAPTLKICLANANRSLARIEVRMKDYERAIEQDRKSVV